MYEDNSLICKISNSAIKVQGGKYLRTLKKDKDNHGFGIENIESALSKYRHICRFKQEEKEFQLSFVIFENWTNKSRKKSGFFILAFFCAV